MSQQNLLIKSLKLLRSGFLKYYTVQPYISYTAYSNSSVFKHQKFKYCTKTSSTFVPSNNIHTTSKFDHSEEDLSQPLVKFTLAKANGEEFEIEGRVGNTVMEAGAKYKLIEGSCEGQLACTTCHVYVEDVNGYLPETTDSEDDLLDAAPFQKPNSRLSCQLVITPELENARFGLPIATANFAVDKKQNQSG